MVRKRGGRWHYDFQIRFTRYRGAIPEAQCKREAEQAEARIRNALFEGVYGSSERPTQAFADFIKEVYIPWARANKKSWANDVSKAPVLCEYFAGKQLRDVTPMMIEEYKRHRLNTTTVRGGRRQPNTVNKELQLLSKIFNMALDNGLLESNPCSRVRKFKVDWQRDRYLSQEEEGRLMAQLTGRYAHLAGIVTIALNTGMRRGEILGLEWSRIDFHRNVIWVKRTKSGKPKYLPMNSVVRAVLTELRSSDPDSEFVFDGPTGAAMTDIKNSWRTVTRKAGIHDFRFHDLRHTAGTRMAEAGIDIRTIAEMLGHSNIQMTMRYVHATDENKRRAAEALAAYAPPSTTAHRDTSAEPSRRFDVTNMSQSESGERGGLR